MLHGLRIGEALGMTWENIDLEHNTITVNQQLQDISMKLRKGTRFETDSYQITTILKTVRSERNVPLQPPTKKMLLRTAVAERNGLCSRDRTVNPLLMAILGKGISTW